MFRMYPECPWYVLATPRTFYRQMWLSGMVCQIRECFQNTAINRNENFSARYSSSETLVLGQTL